VAYVVAEACIRCKYTDCVVACPVDCFHESEEMLVIDPDECINCNACVPACPVNAITHEDEVPEDQLAFTAYNAKMSKLWPLITAAKPPHDDVDDYRGKAGKKSIVGL
jgi:ferredoxin